MSLFSSKEATFPIHCLCGCQSLRRLLCLSQDGSWGDSQSPRWQPWFGFSVRLLSSYLGSWIRKGRLGAAVNPQSNGN